MMGSGNQIYRRFRLRRSSDLWHLMWMVGLASIHLVDVGEYQEMTMRQRSVFERSWDVLTIVHQGSVGLRDLLHGRAWFDSGAHDASADPFSDVGGDSPPPELLANPAEGLLSSEVSYVYIAVMML